MLSYERSSSLFAAVVLHPKLLLLQAVCPSCQLCQPYTPSTFLSTQTSPSRSPRPWYQPSSPPHLPTRQITSSLSLKLLTCQHRQPSALPCQLPTRSSRKPHRWRSAAWSATSCQSWKKATSFASLAWMRIARNCRSLAVLRWDCATVFVVRGLMYEGILGWLEPCSPLTCPIFCIIEI